MCSTFPLETPWEPRGYLHRTLPLYYCTIPKVALTFMEGFLPRVFDSASIKLSFEIVSGTSSQRERIENAFSYVFVRDPYSRLFSAFENKLFLPNKFWHILGKDVVRTVRGPSRSNETGNDVTFYEMVKYFVTKNKRGEPFNGHLIVMSQLCDPCTVRFDFIGKLETMSLDVEALLERLENAGFINKTAAQRTARAIESETKSAQMYGPVSHLFATINENDMHLDKRTLFLRTWAIYQIRGIILKKFKMPFKKTIETVRAQQFRAALKTAIDQSKDHKELLRAQREEALVQAYRTIPLDLMQELRSLVKRDCQLFGYNDMPGKLFSRNSTNASDFYYFKGLSI